jgi:hypothetical protein
VNIRRALLERNEGYGLVMGNAAVVHAEDLIVRDGEADPRLESFGYGVLANSGQLSLRRIEVTNNRTVGLAVAGEGTTLDLEDAFIHDMRGMDLQLGPYSGGIGLFIIHGVNARIVRTELRRNRLWGALLQGVHAELEDLVIAETQSQDLDENYGGGLVAYEGADVTVARARIEGNRQVGVLAADRGTTLSLADAVVRGTRPAACSHRGGVCVDTGIGSGVIAVRGGAVHIERFLIADNALAGVHVASSTTAGDGQDGSLDAVDGQISDNPIGADVELEEYDLTRISQRVLYRDNGRDLQSITLPIPAPSPFAIP